VLQAAPAPYPESSKRYLIIALAGFSSLAICLFAIVALELIDVSIKNPDKFKRIVGLPLVGMLNKIDSKNFSIRSYFNQATSSEETEMFKSLLRKLRHEIETTNGKVILFTSPKKKDGKTFVMFSLAYVLSLINKRVLVIDTNFKNNSLSQMLVKPQTEIKVLEGKRVNLMIGTGKKDKKEENSPEADSENTYDLINPTKYKNIFIVGNAGGGNESPAEILSGRDFTNLIAVLVESFDYVLMEGAALNDYSDTKELVEYSDKVFAIFSADSTVKQLDKESIAYFKSLGKKFGGSILNRVNTKDMKL
jgi:Mrp family chromosome partitioning ATPase